MTTSGAAPGRPTARRRLADVAELAGVSAQTVSNVLNGRTGFSEATRSRVMAAVDQLRFQPDRAARHLRTRRSGQLGLHLPPPSSARATASASASCEPSSRLPRSPGSRSSSSPSPSRQRSPTVASTPPAWTRSSCSTSAATIHGRRRWPRRGSVRCLRSARPRRAAGRCGHRQRRSDAAGRRPPRRSRTSPLRLPRLRRTRALERRTADRHPDGPGRPRARAPR